LPPCATSNPTKIRPLFRVIPVSKVDVVVTGVLREQITGRVVRRRSSASRTETDPVSVSNAALLEAATATSVRAVDSVDNHIVMFVMNLSSVAVLWFGAKRINSGAKRIGSVDRLLDLSRPDLDVSVMMATFCWSLARRPADAERIEEVLDTESSMVLRSARSQSSRARVW